MVLVLSKLNQWIIVSNLQNRSVTVRQTQTDKRDSQTNRQTNVTVRQTGRQTDRQTDRQTGRYDYTITSYRACALTHNGVYPSKQSDLYITF